MGDLFPQFSGVTTNNHYFELPGDLEGNRTICGFLSEGCLPCQNLIEYLDTLSILKSKKYKIIFFSLLPESFKKSLSFEFIKLNQEFFENFNITIFPTIVGVNEKGEIDFVKIGFDSALQSDFL